jgi:type IV secretion system protein TrbL
MSCAPWDPAGCASDIAKSAAGDAFGSIAKDFAKAAGSAVDWLWGQTSSATVVHLGGASFSVDAAIVGAIAVTVALGLFVLQVAASALRRDPSGLGRAVRGLFAAFIGGGLAIAATDVLLSAVDALSNGVVQAATGDSMDKLGHSILSSGAIQSATANPAGLMLLSLAVLAAVIIVWAALMIRKLLIVVSAVFAPLAFAGSLSDVTSSWVRRWIEVMAALIISKLVLVLIFLIGAGMLVHGEGQSGSGTAQTSTQAVTGVLVLAMAGFAPCIALRLVHWSGDQFHHLHSMAAASSAGAQKAAMVPQKAAAWSSSGFGTGAAAGGLAARVAANGGAERQAHPSPGLGRNLAATPGEQTEANRPTTTPAVPNRPQPPPPEAATRTLADSWPGQATRRQGDEP